MALSQALLAPHGPPYGERSTLRYRETVGYKFLLGFFNSVNSCCEPQECPHTPTYAYNCSPRDGHHWYPLQIAAPASRADSALDSENLAENVESLLDTKEALTLSQLHTVTVSF